MNKEIIVQLLQRDIRELELLTKGFEELDTFPNALLNLATSKTENIILSLSKLKEFGTLEHGAFDYEMPFDAPFIDDNVINEEKNGDLPTESNEYGFAEEASASIIAKTGIIEAPHEHEIASKKLNELGDITENEETEKTSEEVENVEKNNENIKTTDREKELAKKTGEEEETKTQQPLAGNTAKKQTLEESIGNQRVEDIRQAMNIGDRFRFQRELFDGNGEVMNKIISYLNQLANFEEAERFLKGKFDWKDENPYAEEFLQIVKRRY